jgi:hypothetical protein
MPAPVNTVAPAITGTLEVGYTLDCSEGTWTGGVQSYAYQWYRINDNAVAIDGAISSSYDISSLDTGHSLKCVVTATNNTGSTSADSNTTTVIPADWFIVEDGTGRADALSYISVHEADLYHARRGNHTWGNLSIGSKKAALVKATEYIGQIYRMVWKGSRVNAIQALDWPRVYVVKDDLKYDGLVGYETLYYLFYYPSDEVAIEVKNATAILALKSVSGELISDLTQTVIKERVDVLEVEYDKNSPQWVRYREIDNLLRPLLVSTGANRQLLRA